MNTIQWYPGHIAKHERLLKEQLKLVDVVVEVLDARIPEATTNHRLEESIAHKPVILVLNKTDLADPIATKRWKTYLKKDYNTVMTYDCSTGREKKNLIQKMITMGEPVMKKLEAQGRKRRPVRVLVAGMPNVGKSSVINNVVGKKKARTGHQAGVTRQKQWIRIHPDVELLDTPGIIPPTLDDQHSAYLLALVNSVGEAAFEDEEAAKFLMEFVPQRYPNIIRDHYNLSDDDDFSLASIAQSRHYVESGGSPDELRAAQAILSDFRHGRLGKLSLEHAPNQTTPQKETKNE